MGVSAVGGGKFAKSRALPRIFLAIAILVPPSVGRAQENAAPAGDYVSRAEYDKLKSELETLKAQMAQLIKNQTQQPPAAPAERPSAEFKAVTSPQSEVSELRDELAKVKEIAESSAPGTTKFLLTGYAFAGFEKRHGEPSTFTAGLAPIFLWELSDKLFFEGELELGLNDTETEVNLEYAQLTYLLNDYITVGAGKFLTPFDQFPARLHPPWINKLPDFPLVFNEDEGLVPFSQVGAQVLGAIPIGPTKLLYAVYVSNGPRLNIDADSAGSLQFDNFTDIDHDKALGGRVGFLPLAELEIGYSIEYARMKATDASADHADLVLQGVDMSYIHDFDWIKGRIDARAEWVWSKVSNLTYDPDGSLGFGPLKFNNWRTGGYAQLAYRPSKIKLPIIDKLELVARYDRIDEPNEAPGAFDERRWTFGLNYWLGPSTVIKAAFETGHRSSSDDQDEDVTAYLLQAAMGF
jgi:hypothetical protein